MLAMQQATSLEHATLLLNALLAEEQSRGVVQVDTEYVAHNEWSEELEAMNSKGEELQQKMPACHSVAWFVLQTCGNASSENCTYFQNPGFPSTYDVAQTCSIFVSKKDPNICQYKLDLLTFDITPPTDGDCDMDMFSISGQNTNSVFPPLCGLNSGQTYNQGQFVTGWHLQLIKQCRLRTLKGEFLRKNLEKTNHQNLSNLVNLLGKVKIVTDLEDFLAAFLYRTEKKQREQIYTDVSSSQGPIILSMTTAGSRPRSWNIKITQIRCDDPSRAPDNCLQYFTGASGSIKSINYATPGTGADSGYLNDLQYNICIRKEMGFCDISYDTADMTFFIDSAAAAGDAGVGDTSCPADFLIIQNEKYCSDQLQLNEASGQSSHINKSSPLN
ncbi:hypothetical protein GQR58_005414 [Nymphon striatum]|nr:hypothetical protein GQR58_005414 [Nymphon striatum]